MTRLAVAIVAAGMITSLGCTSDRHADMSRAGSPMAAAAGDHAGMGHGASGAAAAGPHDAGFIDMMIPHHQSAIDVSKEAMLKGEHVEIRELAQRIITAQQAEIDQLEAWRRAWYPGLPAARETAMPMGMALSPESTVSFDGRFIDAMIPHHEGAIDMATRALAAAEHAEIRDLAARIVASQQAEIDQMKAWRAQWAS